MKKTLQKFHLLDSSDLRARHGRKGKFFLWTMTRRDHCEPRIDMAGSRWIAEDVLAAERLN